jgi:UDP-GlcNAc:undecaprenyl-phosphate GlcNAc-1-phosphate transferase
MKRIAEKVGAYDIPSERKIHKDRIPILGGLAIISAFLLAETIVSLISGIRNNFLFLILVSYLPILIISIYDDLKGVNPYLRLLVQILSSSVIVTFGLWFGHIRLPFSSNPLLSIFYIIITIGWFLLLINSFNFIDGLDGLAAGIATIASLIIFINKLAIGNTQAALMCLGICGASLGFLRFNFFPAKIFMGDTGANFLGFIFAAIALDGQSKTVTIDSFLITIAALSLPIINIIHHFVYRTTNGKNLFIPDKDQIHHRLLELGFHQKWIVIGFYLLTVMFGGISLLHLVQSRIYVYVFLIFSVIIFSIIWFKKSSKNISNS